MSEPLSGEDEGLLEAEAQALRKVQPDHGNVSPGGSGEEKGTPWSLTSFTGIYGTITDSSSCTGHVTLAGTASSGPGSLYPA